MVEVMRERGGENMLPRVSDIMVVETDARLDLASIGRPEWHRATGMEREDEAGDDGTATGHDGWCGRMVSV